MPDDCPGTLTNACVGDMPLNYGVPVEKLCGLRLAEMFPMTQTEASR